MTAPFELATFLEQGRSQVEALLRTRIEPFRARAPAKLGEAMAYALLAGGKRLRPILCWAVADAVRPGASSTPLAQDAGVALEFVHTYSLAHDDLPAMDDDALRRGKPTCHVVFGEALAILAGDALLTDAFGVLLGGPEPQRARMGQVLADAAGGLGMAGGQALDLWPERPANAEALEELHRLKTGALFSAACALGALCAEATGAQVAAASDFGRALGLCFQIADDLLDVSSTEETLGKPVGSDARRGKATYPSLFGVEGARTLGQRALERARALASTLEREPHALDALARLSWERRA